ncbi:MAG TPA: GGDEF domain-containing protein, partial [Acidobacteriaceae bacterium]
MRATDRLVAFTGREEAILPGRRGENIRPVDEDSSSRGWLSIVGLAVVCLILHGAIAIWLPPHLDFLSTVYIVLVELAAIFACLHTARTAGNPSRYLWRLVALAISLHAIAMSMDARAEFLGTMDNPAPGLHVLFSAVCMIPTLFAVSMQFDSRTLRPARFANAGLAFLTAAMFYVLVFSVVPLHGTNDVNRLLYLSRLFDVADLFLAITATVRVFSVEQNEERRFFYILSIFLWVTTVFPAVRNRILIRHDFVWLDLFISAPYILLAVLIYGKRPRWIMERQPSLILIRAVRSGSPIFLSLGLLLLGIAVSRTHFYIGGAGMLLAIIGYGAMNVLTQTRGFETEESLRMATQRLEKIAARDELTGIANRRTFDFRIDAACRAAARGTQPLSLLMIDVDLFKQLNDESGHLAGDRYLVL